jgi:hypothetical protein
MVVAHGKWGLCLLAAALLAGCNEKSVSPADSGARETVQSYFEALIQRDWQRAYSILDSKSRERVTRDQFVQLAKNYRDLGFEPEAVKLRSCEEHGNEAIAHVFLTGKMQKKDGRYKDAVVLRRTEKGWGIVLSADFGRTRTR